LLGLGGRAGGGNLVGVGNPARAHGAVRAGQQAAGDRASGQRSSPAQGAAVHIGMAAGGRPKGALSAGAA